MDEKNIVSTEKTYNTTNYTIFKKLKGNRAVDEQHVRFWAKRLAENNLLPKYPISVNENMEVLDGQHRLAACEQLRIPIYYQVKEFLNINDVIQLNSGNRNWSWNDYAISYAERGNKNYIEFLRLHDTYGVNFGILMVYCDQRNERANNVGSSYKFQMGDLVLPDIAGTEELLKQYAEIVEITGNKRASFAKALYGYMRYRGYDHSYMLAQIRKYGKGLDDCYIVSDFLTELEKIYETHDVDFSKAM